MILSDAQKSALEPVFKWARQINETKKLISDFVDGIECDNGKCYDDRQASAAKFAISRFLREVINREAQVLAAMQIEVTDSMAFNFHHALTDGSIGESELEEIKIGLRAALSGVVAAIPIPKQEPVGRNRYGLDMSYMVGKLNILIRDIDNYKGDEAARTLLRLAKVADESVFSEPEFSASPAAIPQSIPDVASDEMLGEGVEALRRGLLKFPNNLTQIVSNIWEDMYSASPTPDQCQDKSKTDINYEL